MAEVLLHIYNMKTTNVKINKAIIRVNKLMRDRIGAGGIFHGAIQVYDKEWSYGFCKREQGSGIYSDSPKGNLLYSYRETVSLGRTTLSPLAVDQILEDMQRAWSGFTYDLLYKNCHYFCEDFSARLGVQKPPLWVNRFAKMGKASVGAVINKLEKLERGVDKVVSVGRFAYRYFLRSFTCRLLKDST